MLAYFYFCQLLVIILFFLSYLQRQVCSNFAEVCIRIYKVGQVAFSLCYNPHSCQRQSLGKGSCRFDILWCDGVDDCICCFRTYAERGRIVWRLLATLTCDSVWSTLELSTRWQRRTQHANQTLFELLELAVVCGFFDIADLGISTWIKSNELRAAGDLEQLVMRTNSRCRSESS